MNEEKITPNKGYNASHVQNGKTECPATLNPASRAHASENPEDNIEVRKSLGDIITLLEPVNFQALTNRHRFEEFLVFWKEHIQRKVQNPGVELTYEKDDDHQSNDGPESILGASPTDAGEEVKKDQYKVIAIELLKIAASEANRPLMYQMNKPYIFIGTHWAEISHEGLGVFLKSAMITLHVDRILAPNADFLNKVRKQLEESTGRPPKGLARNLINFKNGTLDIKSDGTVGFREHRPEDLLRYALPYEYDKNAECPKFQKFLDEVIPEPEKQQNLAEFFGSCFSDVKHEKVMLLYGTGANGKSVVLEIITRLFGEDNIAHNTLQEITNSHGYFRGTLMDCLLNYAGEISERVNPDALKRMASREPMNARHVRERAFVVKDYCRAAFNCNQFPEVKDNSDGFFRRFMIVHFAVTIPKEKQKPRLPGEICETDLPGIMNWMIDGLQRLLKQEGRFTHSPSSEALLEEYRRLTNSTELFIETLRTDGPRRYQSNSLYADYKRHCIENELSVISRRQFSAEVQKHGMIKCRLASGVHYELA